MTLELARKRREQGDLIDELVAALEPLARRADSIEELGHPGGWVSLRLLVAARAVLAKAKEHDCIPQDDAK